jgi:hypothetical protein
MLTIAIYTFLALAPQGAQQEPDPGVPGDEGALRSQSYVPIVSDALWPRIAEALGRIAAGPPAPAFATLRAAFRECKESGGGALIPLDADRGGRLYTDIANVLRARAAHLSGAALENYLSDAAPAAAADLADALTLQQLIYKSSQWPRTDAGRRALEHVYQQLMERGDFAGARAAVYRLLQSQVGSTADRATWWAAERALAAQCQDLAPVDIPPQELDQTIMMGGKARTLRSWIESLGPRAEPIAPPSPTAFVERWRVAVPPQAKVNLSEPIERVAVDLGDRILLQTLSDLLLLDAKTGQIVDRVTLDPSIFKKPGDNDPFAQAAEPDRQLVFLGKRRARPASDGRFVAATAGGALWLFERVGDKLQFCWARGGGRWLQAGGAEASEKDIDHHFFCDGAALVGGRVFVTSIQLSTDTSTWLHAFAPRDGEAHFRSFLCKGSVSSAADEKRFVSRLDAVVPQPVALCGGRVLVATEMGIVASVDPLDGTMAYVLRLQRSPQPGGYEPSAPAMADSTIYLSPGDSDYIYALSPDIVIGAQSTPLPMAFDRAPQRRRNALFSRLVGAVDSRAILYGREQQVRRTLTSFDFDARTRTLDNLPMGPGEETTGLAALIGKYLFVPTNHGITLYEASRPMVDLWQHPLPVDATSKLPLRGNEALGDLTILPDGVLSVGRQWILCFDRGR